MNTLIIESERALIHPLLLAPLRQEMEFGGIDYGCLALGEVPGEPTMVYLLWHGVREAPVSMMTERNNFNLEADARFVGTTFVTKWKDRRRKLA